VQHTLPNAHLCRTLWDVVQYRLSLGQAEWWWSSMDKESTNTCYPLPDIFASLRTNLYPHLAPIANPWNEMMNISDISYPENIQIYRTLSWCWPTQTNTPAP